jgi:hypothetical protein
MFVNFGDAGEGVDCIRVALTARALLFGFVGHEFEGHGERIVPLGERFLPFREHFVPFRKRFVPPGERFVPPGERFVPPGKRFVPACKRFHSGVERGVRFFAFLGFAYKSYR